MRLSSHDGILLVIGELIVVLQFVVPVFRGLKDIIRDCMDFLRLVHLLLAVPCLEIDRVLVKFGD
jgi:hypothetical protein